MKDLVERYVGEHAQCQLNKAERQKQAGLLLSLQIPNQKWTSILMDFVIGLPHTSRGHDAIWVIVECLNKMRRFISSLSTIKSYELAHLFMENLYKFCDFLKRL